MYQNLYLQSTIDIENSQTKYSANQNNIQVSDILLQTHHQHVLVNNYSDTFPSFPNGNTSDTNMSTCTGTNQIVYLHGPQSHSPQQTHSLQSNLPSDIEENNDYDEVQTETTNPIEDKKFIQIINYSRDKLVDSDVQEGWGRIEPDIIPDHGPFTDTQGLSMSTNSRKQEDFFNDMFDVRMFTIMA